MIAVISNLLLLAACVFAALVLLPPHIAAAWGMQFPPASTLSASLALALAGIGLGRRRKRPQATKPPSSAAHAPAATAKIPAEAAQHGWLVQDATDREFLPAALELLETPPSPIRVAALWFICVAFATALLLSYIGRIDIHAVAQGRIQPPGRSKVVQPFEPGVVVSLAVANGQAVAAGDLLVVLDPTESGADREAQARDLESSRAEAARRRLAVAEARGGAFNAAPITFPADTPQSIRQREELLLASELGQLKAALSGLEAQSEEKRAAAARLKASIAARERLLKLTQERVDMRETVNGKGSLSRAMVIESLQQHEQQLIAQASERGQLTETEAGIVTTTRKAAETVAQFIAEQSQKLAEAERKADRTTQELVKARTKNERTSLRAPISGTVQQLAVTTIGQVVTTGQALLTIVPADAPVEIEALVQNQDIGFVEEGQTAVVKVEAFPFTRFGTIEGKIVRVSRDAVEERDATSLSDPSAAVKPQSSGAAPTGRGQNLVFPATISLSHRTMSIEGKEFPLSPGMAVTVEILTGDRRAIDYVLSPLREVAARTAHER